MHGAVGHVCVSPTRMNVSSSCSVCYCVFPPPVCVLLSVFSLWWGKGHIVATTQNALQFQRSSYCRLSAEQRTSHLSEGESGTGGNGMSCVFVEPGVGWGH